MPTYEYQCKKCDYVFEQFQSIKDAPLKKCPKCKGAVRRLIGTGAGIIFKGSGFYETDYKKKASVKHAGKKETEKTAEKKVTETSGTKNESASSGKKTEK